MTDEKECPHGKGVYRCDDSDECRDKQVRASLPNASADSSCQAGPGDWRVLNRKESK